MKNPFSSLFSKLPRTIKWPLYAFAFLVSAIILGWTVMRDEPLNPDAKRLLEQRVSVPDEQNASYALWGLRASPELDSVAVGKKIVEAQSVAIKQNGYWAEFKPEIFLGEKPMRGRTQTQGYCARPENKLSCLSSFRDNRASIEAQRVELAVYLQRYQALRVYLHFEEVTIPAPNAIFTGANLSYLSKLTDAKTVFDMAQPALRAQALDELHEEINLWRRMNREADSLIMRMQAMSLVESKYRLASDLLHEYPEIATQHREIIAKITQPLSADDISMRRVLVGEFRFGALTMQNMTTSPYFDSESQNQNEHSHNTLIEKLLLPLVYKTNATTNARYFDLMEYADFYSKNSADIVAGETAFKSGQKEYPLWDPRFWFYNPMGKILNAVATPAHFDGYVYRAHDIAAYSRLVELQRQLASSAKPANKIPDFLAAAEPNLRDPYTNQPMAFDAVTNTISFVAKSKNYREEKSLVVKLVATAL